MAKTATTPKIETNGTAPAVSGQLSKEYVAAPSGWASIRPAVIPSHSDTVATLPVTTIKLMATDPVIQANEDLLKELVLADGIQIIPKIDDNEEGGPDAEPGPNTKKAIEYAQFITRIAEQHLETPLRDLCEGLLDGIKYGNKIAEQTFEAKTTGTDAGKLVTKYIKVKDCSAVQFVVDAFWNIVGLKPGVNPSGAGMSGDTPILPRIKFVVFTYHKENEDPRGRSGWRSLFSPWKFKQITWPILERFMKQCAIGGLIGMASPTSKPETAKDSSGNPVMVGGVVKTLNPTEVLLEALKGWENSTVIACAPGTVVEQVKTESEGGLFTNVISLLNREITQGQLRSTRATTEAEHGSKADSQTSLDLLSTFVWYLKGRLIETLRNDVVKTAILLNFGPDELEFAPDVMMGDSDRYDWAEDATALAALAQHLTDSQWDAICQQSGIEPPLPGEERPKAAAPIPAEVDPATGKPKQPIIDPKKEAPKVYRQIMARDVLARRNVMVKIPLRVTASSV